MSFLLPPLPFPSLLNELLGCPAKALEVMIKRDTDLALGGLESNINSGVTRIHISYNLVHVTMGIGTSSRPPGGGRVKLRAGE